MSTSPPLSPSPFILSLSLSLSLSFSVFHSSLSLGADCRWTRLLHFQVWMDLCYGHGWRPPSRPSASVDVLWACGGGGGDDQKDQRTMKTLGRDIVGSLSLSLALALSILAVVAALRIRFIRCRRRRPRPRALRTSLSKLPHSPISYPAARVPNMS